MTDDQIAAIIAEFIALVPEYTQYDCDENGETISNYILANNLDFNAGSLMGAFMVLRRLGKLKQVETAEERTIREQAEAQAAAEQLEEIKRAARREQMLAENDRQFVPRHIGQSELESLRSNEESRHRKAEDQIRDAVQKRREEIQKELSCPTIYIETGRNAGRIDWAKTYDARKAAGYTREGHYVGVENVNKG